MYAGLLYKLNSYGISGQIFGLFLLFSVISHFEWLWIASLHKEYLVNAGVHEGSILGPILFLLYNNDFLSDAICDITVYADDTTLCSKCDKSSDLW